MNDQLTPSDQATVAQAPAGLATTALRPAVQRLVDGPAAIGELVAASGVSRRGIEALLASWGPAAGATASQSPDEDSATSAQDTALSDATPGDTPAHDTAPDTAPEDTSSGGPASGDPASVGLRLDDDLWTVTEPLRTRLIVDWSLEHAVEAGRFDRPEVRSNLERWSSKLPAPRRELDHRPATSVGVTARLDLLDRHLDLRGARVLLLGARDLDALAVAADGRAAEVAAVDVDDSVLGALRDAAATETELSSPLLRWCDVRVGLPVSLVGWADLVITDPPYTPAGVAAFLAAAAAALAGPESRVAVSYGFGETRATLGWQVQREMVRAAFAMYAMWPDAVTYEGAEAIGGRADLYLLAPTGREPAQAEIAHNLYTQGPAAARSATEADPAPLNAATAEAGRLADELSDSTDGGPAEGAAAAQHIGVRRLLGGDQAPKLRAGSVPVVDLRGDPGGWLPRALMALASPTAVLVCDVDTTARSTSPAPRDPTVGRGWVDANLAGQWRLEPAQRAVEGADLLVATRIDAQVAPSTTDGRDPAGPQLVGRGHANPRNLIAEWLTRSSDPEARLTRRQARSAAQHHLASIGVSVQPGDALVDLPLDRIAAILARPAPDEPDREEPG